MALARSDRDGISRANCCPQSSYTPYEDLDENTRLVMNCVMTSPAVSKPTDKRVTSNTSHTAPGSSPASPLSSRSSPPHSQVVTRRTHEFSGASSHSTHCCAGRLLAAAAVATVCWCCCGCRCSTMCNVLLSLLSVSRFSHSSLSLPATFPVPRTSCAALVAARHTFRRSLAVRK